MEFKRKSAATPTEPHHFTLPKVEIKEWSSLAINDKMIFATTSYWLLGLIACVGLIVYFLPHVPYEIPLFFSRTFGPDQLADRNQIYMLPSGLFMIGLANFITSLKVYIKNKEASYLLSIGTIIVVTLVFLAIVNILRLTV